jgi:hypothetical protein
MQCDNLKQVDHLAAVPVVDGSEYSATSAESLYYSSQSARSYSCGVCIGRPGVPPHQRTVPGVVPLSIRQQAVVSALPSQHLSRLLLFSLSFVVWLQQAVQHTSAPTGSTAHLRSNRQYSTPPLQQAVQHTSNCVYASMARLHEST